MTNTLQEGAFITVKVTAATSLFQARGRVVYSDRNVGSGVVFQGVESRHQAVLEEWLLEAQKLRT
jgi:thymidylate kinase